MSLHTLFKVFGQHANEIWTKSYGLNPGGGVLNFELGTDVRPEATTTL